MSSQYAFDSANAPFYDPLAAMGTQQQTFNFSNLTYLPNYSNAMAQLHGGGYIEPNYQIPYEITIQQQQYHIDPQQTYIHRPSVIYQSTPAASSSESLPTDLPELLRPRPLPVMSSVHDNTSNSSFYATPARKQKPTGCQRHATSICSVCGTSNTTLWRRSQTGAIECNACNLYYRKNNKRRPRDLRDKPIVKRNRRKAPAYKTQLSLLLSQDTSPS
ncbi:hypothetical protein QR680_019212 [Steinernema hermaphroditum]|uniref:GATA-type domain-containing protein n=1 Tax=Steinernema hermaphroditum TaxID=289476 RepID=A0AA39HMI6_9BILA|nr:hypothetical protein QR680_019212 [Steinernema hermaphroditum]